MKKKTVDPIENAPIADDTETTTVEPIDREKEDMQRQINELIAEAIALKDRCTEERRARARDRSIFDETRLELHQTIEGLHADLAKSRDRERKAIQRRHSTISRLVLIALVALVALVIPYFLQNLSVIGPQLSYTIQCGLFMTIAWCMALIWDRSR